MDWHCILATKVYINWGKWFDAFVIWDDVFKWWTIRLYRKDGREYIFIQEHYQIFSEACETAIKHRERKESE